MLLTSGSAADNALLRRGWSTTYVTPLNSTICVFIRSYYIISRGPFVSGTTHFNGAQSTTLAVTEGQSSFFLSCLSQPFIHRIVFTTFKPGFPPFLWWKCQGYYFPCRFVVDDIFTWNPSVGGGDYRAAFVCCIVFLAGNMSSFPVAIVRDYDSNKRLLSWNVVNVPKFSQCSLFVFFARFNYGKSSAATLWFLFLKWWTSFK